jgi:hypothetical protein
MGNGLPHPPYGREEHMSETDEDPAIIAAIKAWAVEMEATERNIRIGPHIYMLYGQGMQRAMKAAIEAYAAANPPTPITRETTNT